MDFDQQDLMMTMVMTQMDKLPGFHPDIPGSSADHRLPLSMMSVDPTLSSRLPPSISFSGGAATASSSGDAMGTMREMIFRMAVMQPVHIDPESVKPPKRRNVRISKDPQSVAARHRRERISERIRILQRLVPGGTKMDTASMLDEAIHYVKFLKSQVQSLERANGTNRAVPPPSLGLRFPVVGMSNGCSGSTNYLSTTKASYHR